MDRKLSLKKAREFLLQKDFECKKCEKIFKRKSPRQIFCGNYRKKDGCSYQRRLEKSRGYAEKYKPKRKHRLRFCFICHNEIGKYKKYCQKCKEKLEVERKIKKKKIGKLRTRFQVFQRDNFTCQYCGRKVPEVKLQIDHKYPKSKGGENKIENYITACGDCNLGKGDILLEKY